MKFKIIKGLGQGFRLGFPTINLRRPAGFRLTQGVYACFAKIGRKIFSAALYHGPKYNFGIFTPSLEIHLINFDGIARAARAEIDVVKKVRGVRKFASVATLKKQIRADVAAIKKILHHTPSRLGGTQVL